jgi:hypothetical protein
MLESKLETLARPGWEGIDANLKVVRLTAPLKLLIPALIIPSLPERTRGLSLYPGRIGGAIGSALVAASVLIGIMLFGRLGLLGPALSVWLLGTAGATMLLSLRRPMAFVKPICVGCRLLPVIKEHEAIHLSGVAGEKAVWDSMKSRYSVQSLGLEGDPAICSFCPIPKRLSEH